MYLGIIMKENITLQLQTFPASKLEFADTGLKRYRKELIRIGKYIKDAMEFEVTSETLQHWVDTFNRWVGNGNKVPIPAGHNNDPLKNQGWVRDLFVEGDSLYGILELADEKLSKTTDVSISVPYEVVDGKGNKYERMIEHVALCVDPVVSGLGDFVTLSLSLKDKLGDKEMTILEKIAEKLGIKTDKEDLELSLPETDTKEEENIDNFIKVINENRTLKLSGLVKAGIITPAIKDLITEKYVSNESLKVELSREEDEGHFDFLFSVLSNNKPVDLKEVSGPQSLELSNQSKNPTNCVEEDIKRRREKAGLDN